MDSFLLMNRCLELAEKGRGSVGINPMVGSVLVRSGEIIAEAFHEGFGKRHAERALLEDFNGSIEADDILYVNLEPCSCTGKTPACTDIIMESGVKNVVYGASDSSQDGTAALRKAGVNVIASKHRELCQRFNRGFFMLQGSGRPWITLKKARTGSGAIANSDGSMMKITSKDQDIWSHTHLRAKHDAILVGVGTLLTDDPQLNTRLVQNKKSNQFSPLKIGLDPHFKIDINLNVISKEQDKTLIFISDNNQKKREVLEERGVKVIQVPMQGECFDFDALFKFLTTPQDDFHGITSILVEGGPRTWQIFEQAGFVDEEVTLVGI